MKLVDRFNYTGYTPETWPTEKYRPVLRKMIDACEEAGLSWMDIDQIAEAFQEMANNQFTAMANTTDYHFLKTNTWRDIEEKGILAKGHDKSSE